MGKASPYRPRYGLAVWERPFAWTVSHMRNPSILGVLAGFCFLLTGVGILFLLREYLHQREEEAYISGRTAGFVQASETIDQLKRLLEEEKKKRSQSEALHEHLKERTEAQSWRSTVHSKLTAKKEF